MNVKTTPNKSHSNKPVTIYSTFWKESDGLGRMIRGTYKHHDKQPTFTLIHQDKDLVVNTEVLIRSEWVVIDERIAAWIDEYRLWINDKQISEYRRGFCEALFSVIRHALMN